MQRRDFMKFGASYGVSSLGLPFVSGCGGGGGDTPAPTPVARCTAGVFAKGLSFAPPEMLAQIAPVNRLPTRTDGFPSSWDNTTDKSDYGMISGFLPPIGDQGQLGSCVAWGTGYAMSTAVSVLSGNSHRPLTADSQASPADLYAKLLLMEQQGCGQGTYVKHALDILVKEGVASMALKPYAPNACTVPSNGGPFMLGSYTIIDPTDIDGMRLAVLNQRIVAIGMQAYPDFEALRGVSATTVYSHPASDTTCGQGHCIAVTAYDDNLNAFKIMNSWRTDWGSQGSMWISYDTFRRIVSEAYVPYVPVRSQVGTRSTLIDTPSRTAGGISILFGRSYNQTNKSLTMQNSINVDFDLSDAICLNGYAIYYADPDTNQVVNLVFKNGLSQWVRSASYSADIADTSLLNTKLKRGTSIGISLGGLSRSNAPISNLIGWTKLEFNSR